ncbi:MAG TPA: Na+:solute symporter [Bacteroidales bacterium]|jgi:Na+/proline symporter|nr:Na+:solute symporter [Bacteroidales bacterium]
MQPIDYTILIVYFLLLISVGVWAATRVRNSADYFTAGGRLPWWLTGISHHVSGYSGAVFVAYAGVAYTHGFSLYVWWAGGVFISTVVAAYLIAPKWSRLRTRFKIQSPTEYLSVRYNLATQQIMAWCGVIIKIFDVGAKWAAIAILLYVFTGIPILAGILIAGSVSLIYGILGGLLADVLNDFAQFIIQLIAGFTMFFLILREIGDGLAGYFTMWDRLPEAHSRLFNPPYTIGFFAAILIIDFFSYSGGTWHLATRFISSQSGKQAKKAALLSSFLYLLWPLVLFFPMFAAPIFIKDLADPTQSYALMALKFLPTGLLGLVLASLFTNTLSMTSSDANTISAVITRDILPNIFPKLKTSSPRIMLILARASTFLFTALTIIIAIYSDSFGGVFGLIITWFAALVGPISIPMILGLLPWFRKSNSSSAIISIIGGVITFAILKTMGDVSLALEIVSPMLCSLVIYIFSGLIAGNKVPERVDKLLEAIRHEDVMAVEAERNK